MPSRKRLRSVCHSIAHHAVSGLSYVHPHVLRACREAGIESLEVQLLDPEPCPERFKNNEPLRLSLKGLKEKFEGILESEGFSPTDLAGASLSFSRDRRQTDDYCSICRARLEMREGEPVEYAVNYMGEQVGAQQGVPADRLRPTGSAGG